MIFTSAAIIGLVLLPVNHLGNSVGDDLFRWIGISPWTKGDRYGAHLPVILGFVLLIFGTIGVVNIYRPRYPKIMSRLMLGYIAIMLVFPFVTEQLFFLTKFNSTSISSVAYSKKESQCNYSTEGKQVKAVCKLNIYNYGKLEQATIRPIMNGWSVPTEFKPKVVTLRPQSQTFLNEVFYGEQVEDTEHQGSGSGIGLEIEVNGYKKKFE